MVNIAASTQVGETAELIEFILSHLPMQDIVSASGVNKKFRNVILNPVIPVILKRNIFLRATTALPQYWLPLNWQRVTYKSDTRPRIGSIIHCHRIKSPGVIGDAVVQAHLENVADGALDDWTDPTFPLKVVSICPLLKVPARHPENEWDLRVWVWGSKPATIALSVNERLRSAAIP
jgi:hypothetical protein